LYNKNLSGTISPAMGNLTTLTYMCARGGARAAAAAPADAARAARCATTR